MLCRGKKVALKAVRGGREKLPQVQVTSGASTELLIAEGSPEGLWNLPELGGAGPGC